MPTFQRYEVGGQIFEADHLLSTDEQRRLLAQVQAGRFSTPPAAAPPAQATTGQPSIPGLGTPSDILQTAVPTALAAARFTRNPLLLGGAALLSRALPALVSRPKGESLPTAAGREMTRPGALLGEATALVPPGVGMGLRMAAPRALPALETAAARVGLPRAREALSRGAQAVAERFPAAGTAASALRRTFGALFTEPEAGPIAVRSGLRGFLRGLAEPTRDAVMAKVLAETGIHLGKLTSKTLGQFMRTDPERVVRAIRLVESETGRSAEPLLRTIRQTLVSRAAGRALRVPKADDFPAAFRGGEFDRATLLEELAAMRKQLGKGADAVFGREGIRGLDELSRVLAPPTVQGRLRAGTGVASAVRIRAMPFLLALGGYMVGGRVGTAMEVAAGTTFALRDSRRLLRGLLSTPAGMRFLAAGIDLQTRGVADRVLLPALARMAPPVLASLGLGGGTPLPELAPPSVTGAFVGGRAP